MKINLYIRLISSINNLGTLSFFNTDKSSIIGVDSERKYRHDTAARDLNNTFTDSIILSTVHPNLTFKILKLNNDSLVLAPMFIAMVITPIIKKLSGININIKYELKGILPL
jgi:hypothetical protein